MKKSSIIGTAVLLAFCLDGIVGGFLWLWPEETANAIRLGPYSHTGVIIFCLILALIIFVLGWIAEKAFVTAGEKSAKKDDTAALSSHSAQPDALNTDEDTSRFVPAMLAVKVKPTG